MKRTLIEVLCAALLITPFAPGCGDETEDDEELWFADGDTDADADGDADGDADSDQPDYGCIDDVAWYLDNATDGVSHEVGTLSPNAFGLYDMLGNVIEWTSDCYHDSYAAKPAEVAGNGNDPWDETACEYRVQRGGCFGAPASSLRVSKRDPAAPTAYGTCTPGVRCVRDLDSAAIMDGLTDLQWVLVTGGAFSMGCADAGEAECLENELPVHSVTVGDFYIMATEASGRDYNAITGYNPNIDVNFPTRAASKILYSEAAEFCAGVGGRLPTEAEWEYAARGGTTGAFYCQ